MVFVLLTFIPYDHGDTSGGGLGLATANYEAADNIELGLSAVANSTSIVNEGGNNSSSGSSASLVG